MKFNFLARSWKFKKLKTIWLNIKYKLSKTGSEMPFIQFLVIFNEHIHLGLNQSFRDLLKFWSIRIKSWLSEFWGSDFRCECVFVSKCYMMNNEICLTFEYQLKQKTIISEKMLQLLKCAVFHKSIWSPRFKLKCIIGYVLI